MKDRGHDERDDRPRKRGYEHCDGENVEAGVELGASEVHVNPCAEMRGKKKKGVR